MFHYRPVYSGQFGTTVQSTDQTDELWMLLCSVGVYLQFQIPQGLEESDKENVS
jgi:hypothetical protein